MQSRLTASKKSAEDFAKEVTSSERSDHHRLNDKFVQMSQNLTDLREKNHRISQSLFNKLDINKLQHFADNFEIVRDYTFETDIENVEGKNLSTALNYRNAAAQILSPEEDYNERVHLVSIADFSLDLADNYYQSHQIEEGNFAKDIAVKFIDIATSFLPVIGWGRDAYEALTGKSLLNGVELSTPERSGAVFGMITLGIGSKIGKGIQVVKKLLIGKNVLKLKTYRPAIANAEGFVSIVQNSIKKIGTKTGEEFRDLMAWLGRPFDKNKELGAIIIGKYNPPPKTLPAFKNAKLAPKRKTTSAASGKRKRWIDDDGKIIEWDALHAEVEVYNKRGKHLGEFDPETGVQTKPANSSYKIKP